MTQHRPRELIGPPGAFAFTPDRDVCPSRSQDIECQFPQDREVFRPVILAISSAILVKAHIKDPMQTALYPPVRAHREYLRGRFQRLTRNLVVLHGGMTAAARAAAKAMLRVPDGQERLILATGRYPGEGFDDSRLDTLFLTMRSPGRARSLSTSGAWTGSTRARTRCSSTTTPTARSRCWRAWLRGVAPDIGRSVTSSRDW